MKALGVEKYRYLATAGSKTSEICREMDGKVFTMAEYKPGVTAPPLHVWCRSTTVPYFGEKGGLRAARNAEEGPTDYISDMTFKDWESIYVSKRQSYDEWKKKHSGVDVSSLLKELNAIDLATCTPDDVIEIGRKVDDYFGIKAKVGDKTALKDIFSNFRTMGGYVDKAHFAKGSSDENKKRLNEAFSYYPADWADYLVRNNRQLYTCKVQRGFFAPGARMRNGKRYDTKFPNYKDGYVTIHLSDGVTTPYHEIGHFVEFFNPDALRVSKAFIAKRTAGEKPVQLKKLFPRYKYQSWETTKADNFIDPYIGKEYADASEVLSMGLESLFRPRLDGQIKKSPIAVHGVSKN